MAKQPQIPDPERARQNKIVALLSAMKQAAPAGYAIALHVRFTTPLFLFQTYPKAWIDLYSARGLVMKDPTVLWGLENEGTVGWPALAAQDDHGVLDLASEHGLRHGFTGALDRGGSRSIASFARYDAAFDEAEMAEIQDRLCDLHDATAEVETLSPPTRDRLRRLSITFTHP